MRGRQPGYKSATGASPPADPDPSDDALRGYWVPKGLARVIVEVPADLATEAEKRARLLRVPLGRVVEDALRLAISAEGLAVTLAAIIVGISGCQPPAETKPGNCTLPAGLLCDLDASRAAPITISNRTLHLVGES